MTDFDLNREREKLSRKSLNSRQLEILESVWTEWEGQKPGNKEDFEKFVVPMLAAKLGQGEILELLSRLKARQPLNHREIYFDFRLGRWLPHLEPPDLKSIVGEYLQNAESLSEGAAYISGILSETLKNMQPDSGT